MIKREGARLYWSGAATIDNAAALLDSGLAQLSAEVREVDLQGLDDVDSATLGLMLEWQRAARAQHNAQLRFLNVPDNLKSLALLYDVNEMLGLTGSTEAIG